MFTRMHRSIAIQLASTRSRVRNAIPDDTVNATIIPLCLFDILARARALSLSFRVNKSVDDAVSGWNRNGFRLPV